MERKEEHQADVLPKHLARSVFGKEWVSSLGWCPDEEHLKKKQSFGQQTTDETITTQIGNQRELEHERDAKRVRRRDVALVKMASLRRSVNMRETSI